MNPKISKDSSLFELGCGTGKSLEHISNQIKLSKVGGSLCITFYKTKR